MIGGLTKTTSYLAIAAAASLMIGGVAMTPAPARAADLGGDCCADLESRVAELEATTARKGNKKVSLTISGSVTSGILFWDDGQESDANVIQNDAIGGGITFSGSGKISGDLTAGYNLNMDARYGDPGDGAGLQPDASSGMSMVGKFSPSEVYVYLDSKRAGRITMGHHSDPYKSSNGRSDLGGDSGLNAYNGGIIDLAAGIQIRDDAGGFDGGWYGALDNGGGGIDAVRGMSVRYDSPSFSGFTFAGSIGHLDKQNTSVSPVTGGDDVYSAALAYDGTHGDTDISLSAAYQAVTETANGTDTRWLIGGSLYNKPSGLFLTGEYDPVTNNSVTGSTSDNWFVKGGWRKNVNGMGETNIYGGYEASHDVAVVGVDGRGFFIGATQAIDSAASVLYAQYQHMSVDDGACGSAGCEDLNSGIIGMKVSF